MTRAELHTLWKKRMSDFEASKLTGTQWCADQEIPLSQFRYWRRKLRSTRDAASSSRPSWMAVDLAVQEKADMLFIYLGPAKIELHAGFDPDLFADAVRVLRSL
ncbi:IS66 family insertion sequence element accessory protein TnpA [Sporolactobacillus sp. CQH2019]|uniref:IS66 family insertion sequence element accessory protein TnpA n=1 Tax=Sporolactobacillus sp. CQH2019 TaxID=3023512 RepID=UPI003FD52AC4